MRILIVDDDEIGLDVLRTALEKAGYEVKAVRHGREAMEVLQSGWSRMVIADWEMPEISGPELCRQIRNTDFGGYIYIILITSRQQEDDVVEGISAGADDFLTKPLRLPELCVRVRAGERLLSIETRDMAIFAMAKLVESRDPETGAHLERMRYYSRILARELARSRKFSGEISTEYIHLIYLTSPLHDIGKIGIPDSVLLKPGRLSDREFEIMKQHTTIGATMLEAASEQYPGVQFLRMARDIALTHHEQFDGSGYPSGLVGEAIPLCGRIVALADVYDALTSKRVYKEAFAHDVAKAIVLDERGKHFDPEIVDAFSRTEDEFIAIHESFAEGAVTQPPSAVFQTLSPPQPVAALNS